MSERLAFTRKEAAEACGVSEDVIRKAINAGALEAHTPTRNSLDRATKTLITRRALEEWLEALPRA